MNQEKAKICLILVGGGSTFFYTFRREFSSLNEECTSESNFWITVNNSFLVPGG